MEQLHQRSSDQTKEKVVIGNNKAIIESYIAWSW